jgi:predicted dehydrogenase
MKGALVGYGTIAAGHHEAYLSLGEPRITIVADARPERREAARVRDPEVAVYASLDHLLARERLDFIDICLPPSMHVGSIMQGLKANCHVLCEKPFVLDLASFGQILEQAAKSDRLIYPSHNYKFSPVMKRLVREVQSPKFGRLLRGYFLTRRRGHARGVPEWKPDWRRDPGYSGGGILQDHATHSIYLSYHLCGVTPQAVSCILGNLNRDAHAATEDTALMTLHFADGIDIRLDLTWACEHRYTAYTLLGSRRNIVIENDHWLLSETGSVQRQNVRSQFDDPTHRAWFVDLIRDFAASIGDSDKQANLLREAWITCAVIDAAYASAAVGGVRTEIPPVPAALTAPAGMEGSLPGAPAVS